MNPSQYINLFAGRWKWLDYLGMFLARGLAFLLLIGLFVLALAENNLALFFVPVVSAAISRFTINELIWIFYKEERPSSLGSTKVLIRIPHSPSFPSSHACFFFTISFLLFFYNIPLGIIFTVSACLMAFARVFCRLT